MSWQDRPVAMQAKGAHEGKRIHEGFACSCSCVTLAGKSHGVSSVVHDQTEMEPRGSTRYLPGSDV